MTDRASLLAALLAFPDRLAAAVAGLTPAQLTARPVPDEWSIAQNVHHVFDSHVNSYVRCKLILTEDGPVLRPYDEAAWGELPDGTVADVSGTLEMVRLLHERWHRFFSALTEEQWARTGYHPADARLVSLDDQLRIYVEHGDAHLAQLAEVRATL